MASSDDLYMLLTGGERAAAVHPEHLGLGVSPGREDLQAQVDGVDAVDVVPVRWAPALDERAMTVAIQTPRGKPSEASALFGFRGSRPVTLEWDINDDRDVDEDPGAIVKLEVPAPAGPLPAIGFFRDSEDHGGNVPEGPEPDIIAVGSPGTEFESMTVYPSFFRPSF